MRSECSNTMKYIHIYVSIYTCFCQPGIWNARTWKPLFNRAPSKILLITLYYAYCVFFIYQRLLPEFLSQVYDVRFSTFVLVSSSVSNFLKFVMSALRYISVSAGLLFLSVRTFCVSVYSAFIALFLHIFYMPTIVTRSCV